MPAINWFLATFVFLLLCGLAIAMPFVPGLWSMAQ